MSDAPHPGERNPSTRNPLVSVVMGSDSDLPKLRPCLETLSEFGIPFEVEVISAHRSPRRAHEFAVSAEERGIAVIIAAAGGAAHLAGVLASLTSLPVIGVPISSSPLNGLDALYATVQMPPGVPVATVGVDAATNAAILAVQILATADASLRTKLKAHKTCMANTVKEKSRKIREILGSQ
jgi:5-(carboxyamino)imidazole ribonucleotide mutase